MIYYTIKFTPVRCNNFSCAQVCTFTCIYVTARYIWWFLNIRELKEIAREIREKIDRYRTICGDFPQTIPTWVFR